jgi:hypothetical protein
MLRARATQYLSVVLLVPTHLAGRALSQWMNNARYECLTCTCSGRATQLMSVWHLLVRVDHLNGSAVARLEVDGVCACLGAERL